MAPGTLVTQFRLLTGDSVATAIQGKLGHGEYRWFSDEEITGLLASASDSLSRAISYGYAQLAAAHANGSKVIKTDDLSISTVTRSAEWLKLSQYWSDRADGESDSAGADGFVLVEHEFANHPYLRPEASPPQIRSDIW